MDFIYNNISSSPLSSGLNPCPLFVVFHHWIWVAQFNTHPPSHKHLDWVPLYLECTVDCKNVIYIFINMPTVNKICILVASSFFPCSERLFPFTVRTFTLREPGSSTEMCPLMDPGRLWHNPLTEFYTVHCWGRTCSTTTMLCCKCAPSHPSKIWNHLQINPHAFIVAWNPVRAFLRLGSAFLLLIHIWYPHFKAILRD